MKIYELYYHWYEEESNYRFTHPNNKFKMEFEQDVQSLMVKYIDEHIKNYGVVANEENFRSSWIGNDSIIAMVASKLPELGYIPLSETTETIYYGLFGSTIIDTIEDEEALLPLIGADNINKIIAYNKTIEERINRLD